MAEPTFFRGYHTETAGTAITEAIPVYRAMIPEFTKIVYEAGATEHTLTVMRPIATTVTTEASQSGVSTLELENIDPGVTPGDGANETLAGSDWVGWICENNMAHVDSISSVTGNQITLANALTTDVDAGQTIFCFYEVGRATHDQVKMTASTRLEITGPIRAGFDEHVGQKAGRRVGAGDMLMLHVDNATNAGKLHYAAGGHVHRMDVTSG